MYSDVRIQRLEQNATSAFRQFIDTCVQFFVNVELSLDKCTFTRTKTLLRIREIAIIVIENSLENQNVCSAKIIPDKWVIC